VVPLEELQPERIYPMAQLYKESANIDLSEWSTTERIARIQEINSCTIILSVKHKQTEAELKITPQGIEPAVRDIRDGVVYFGCKRKDVNRHIVVDYKCRLNDKNIANKYRGPHFMIYYDLNFQGFFLHDLLIGFGTFVRITESLVLENESLINVGESFILVNILRRNNMDCYPKIRLKLFRCGFPSEVFYFSAQEFYLCSITIGRGKRCHICLNDNMISKQHASIFFTSDRSWSIIDGTVTKNSLNGTWLYVSKDVRLGPGVEFKSCESLFKVMSYS
jgi:hypothetical protein